MTDQQLTQSFTLREFVTSSIAARMGIDNTPPPQAVDCIKALCVNVLQPLRDRLHRPIQILSGYRNPRVNALAHGARSSQHMFGEAADIAVKDITPAYLQRLIRESGIEVDQCILEFDEWVHVSWRAVGPQRNQYLIATASKGGAVYTEA